MAVGLLIISHNTVGQALLETAIDILGVCPLRVEVLAVRSCDEPDAISLIAAQHITQLDTGQGVLILTDMFGSTPCNLAMQEGQITQTVVVSGLNLPMLVRVLNYPRLSLGQLAYKALSGGRDGVVLTRPSVGEVGVEKRN